MKQSELSNQMSGAESALAGAFKRNMPRDRPKYFGCGDVGHIQRYCPRKRKWHKAKITESEKSRQGNSDVDGEEVYAAAFMTSAGNVKSADKECYPWVIDSGASRSYDEREAHFDEFPGI